MLSIVRKLIFAVAMLGFGGATFADDVWSQGKTISAIYVDGNSDSYYILANQGDWSTACPGGYLLWIKRSDPVANQILAALIAARAMGATVWASGSCAGDHLFYTKYIQY